VWFLAHRTIHAGESVSRKAKYLNPALAFASQHLFQHRLSRLLPIRYDVSGLIDSTPNLVAQFDDTFQGPGNNDGHALARDQGHLESPPMADVLDAGVRQTDAAPKRQPSMLLSSSSIRT
jgi:hypothetical protein